MSRDLNFGKWGMMLVADSEVNTVDEGRGDALARLELRRRIRAFTIGARLSLLPAAASILTLLYTFSDDGAWDLLVVWALLQSALLAIFVAIDFRFDIEKAELTAYRQYWRRILVLQFASSTVWVAIFPYLAGYAQGIEIAALGIVASGIFCGTLLVHRTAPEAAVFHVAGMGVSLMWSAILLAGVAAWPTLILIGAFALALLGATRAQERAFRSAAVSEIERRRSDATVRMLLNEYEEHSSDWLWTVGPRGKLREVSQRFAQAVGKPVEDLEGSPFIDVFRTGEERDRLARHLVERSPFRDLLVKLRVDGEMRYWRLSARQREDGRMAGVARDVTSDRLIEERVAFMAHFDNLTGLANRYLFNDRLRSALNSDDPRSSIALFYLDLDDFKAVNDTRGHLVGDRLLREVGARLEQEVRPQDLVARLGGDEFAVLIETRAGTGLLIERAHRFLSVVREPYEIEGNSYRVSTSIGVARCSSGECEAEELMRRADLALFAAKRKGRDALAMFEPALDREARERRSLEIDMREAISSGQLRLHYQPVINLDTGATTGYEALLRWYHPKRGIIGPNDFLPIAEETGMILPIGEWVVRQALAETSRWPGDFRISINLSPTQVQSPHLVTMIAQAMHANSITPERVEFEVTEHIKMMAGGTSHNTLLKLRELGARVALDDFGTGYASLSYLRQFPFDRIKIDKHFVDDLDSSTDNQAIISSITRLADALGMETTAEGIESREQLDLLRKLGCHEAQGFLICEPAPGEQFSTTAAATSALGDKGSEVVEYRRSRAAAIKRRGDRVA